MHTTTPKTTAGERLAATLEDAAPVCVGLDPDPSRFPRALDRGHDAVFRFCKEIVDATADLVCAFKPQIAYFASQREEQALELLEKANNAEATDAIEAMLMHLETLTQAIIANTNELRKMAEERDAPRIHLVQ